MAKNPWVLPEGFDANDAKARKELAKLLGGMGTQIPPEALSALRAGNIQQFQSLINFDALGNEMGPVRELMQAFAAKSGASIYSQAQVTQELVFNLIDERAVEYAATNSAKLVREITEQARENVQQLTASATNGQITYNGMADLLENGGLGLTSRNAQAVANQEARNFARFMSEGLSETASKLKARRLAQDYTNKLVTSRANTIARTEIADAAMQGRLLGWESGVQSGLIDNASVKEWIAEPDACPICAALDGTIVGWNASYGVGVTGTTDKMPPAHPNCRCTVAILPPDYADTVFTNQADADLIDAEAQVFEYRAEDIVAPDLNVNNRIARQQSGFATDDELESLRAYQQAGFMDINADLRGAVDSNVKLTRVEAQKHTKNLDNMINGFSPTKDNLNVGRIVENDFVAAIENLELGSTITDKGFLSTSLSNDYLLDRQQAAERFGTPVAKMFIQVPSNSKGIFVNDTKNRLLSNRLANDDSFATNYYQFANAFENEEEFLLPRNSTLRLVSKVLDEFGAYEFKFILDNDG